MKKTSTYVLLLAVFSAMFSLTGKAQVSTLCQAAPDAISVKQADGSSITVVGKGNSLISYTETADGFTIIKNSAGLYEYAVSDDEGNLVSTDIKAHDAAFRTANETAVIAGLGKHVRMSEAKVQELLKSNMIAGNNSRTSKVESLFPNSGKRNVLMLLIQYPDIPQINTVPEFEDLMNKPNYNGTGSFHDYYMTNSFDSLNLTVDVFGWYTAKYKFSHYGKDSGYSRAADLVLEAVTAAHNAGVNFKKYDNDEDGKVDGLMLVHSGPGAEVGSQTQYIWSHRSAITNNGKAAPNYDGVTINDYMVQPERYGGMIGIGVFCHEFGHSLGLPDLYDVDNSSDGIGEWSIMAGGPYLNGMRTPASFDAWCKIDLGWIKPTVILPTVGTYSLNAASTTKDVYRVNTPVAGEYYLLENRQPNGYDTYLPGHGMNIWHIDSTKACQFRKSGNNNVNADEKHRGVDIVQADGRSDLSLVGSRGDAGDGYPGSTINKTFSDNSFPAAITYNGTAASISIANITEVNGVVSFGYTQPACSAVLNPYLNNSFCTGATGINLNAPTGTAYQWYKNAALISGATSQTYYAATGGKYSVAVTNAQSCTATSNQLVVSELPLPPKPTITLNSSNQLKSSTLTGNQWQYEGTNIPGATANTYKPTKVGKYTVTVKKTGSTCVNVSNPYSVTTGIGEVKGNENLSIYPNPTSGNFFVRLSNATGMVKADLYDITGRVVLTKMIANGENEVETKDLNKGVYFLKLANNGAQTVNRVVVY